MRPYLRKPAIKDKSKMPCNVFQPVVNALQRAVIIFECVGNVRQHVEQCFANFINLLRLTIDRFDCHAIKK